MLTNSRDAFRAQSRSPNNQTLYHSIMLGVVSFSAIVTLSLRRAVFSIFNFKKCCHLEIRVPLTHQHGSQQNRWVTLTFDLLALKVVSESRVDCGVGYLCANFSLPRPRVPLRDLGPMYATDVRPTSDVKHTLANIIALCPRLLGRLAMRISALHCCCT